MDTITPATPAPEDWLAPSTALPPPYDAPTCIDALPNPLLEHALDSCRVCDLCSLACVSRAWRELAEASGWERGSVCARVMVVW